METNAPTPAALPDGFELAPDGTPIGAAGEQADADYLALLDASLSPPENVGRYAFPYNPGEQLSEAARQQDLEVRTWLADASIPANIGSAMAEEAKRFATRVAHHSEEQHEIEAQNAQAALQRLWGPRTAEMLGRARRLVAELDKRHGGRVSAWLDETGLGNCPGLCVQLALHAERIELARIARARVGGK
jgi:hypothetical protein